MEDGLIMIIVLFGLGILCAIALGVGAIIAKIQDKIEKKRLLSRHRLQLF
jgi:hypothetical protein